MKETESHADVNPTRSHFKRVVLPIVIVLSLVVGGLLAIKASVNKNNTDHAHTFDLMEGAQVPELDLLPLDGSTAIKLSSLKHKVMMLTFWATWCEACMVEMPSIVALRDKFAPRGFEVLGINVDENPAKVVPGVVKTMNVKFPQFIDPEGALSEVFDVHAIPLTVIFNQDKKILFVESGERDWNNEEVHQMMEKWLAE
jgi:thiol-disulfide isomerase/thioredoxin